jgi:hypothetical protein
MLETAEIFQKLDEIAALHQEPTRDFDVANVKRDLALFLHQNRDAIDVDRLALSYFAAYDRSRQPKFDSRQLSFFEPEAWIPVGRNRRIEMRFATLAHLRAWEGIETSEHVPSVVAYNRKITYIQSRTAAWDVSKYKTLGDLEAAEFEKSGSVTPST